LGTCGDIFHSIIFGERYAADELTKNKVEEKIIDENRQMSS